MLNPCFIHYPKIQNSKRHSEHQQSKLNYPLFAVGVADSYVIHKLIHFHNMADCDRKELP